MPVSARTAGLLFVSAVAVSIFGAVTVLRDPLVTGVQPSHQALTQTLLVTGRVMWPGRTELGVTEAGTVRTVAVEEGQQVQAEDLLVQLDDREAQARRTEADARVSHALAQLRRLRGPSRSVAAAQVEQATVAARDATRELARQQALYDGGNIPQSELDAAQVRHDTTQAQLRAAEQEAAATSRGGADSAAAYASLEQARAQLAQAELSLSRTQLRAPTAGLVLERKAEPGQLLRPGDVPIVVSGAQPLAVQITPDETHLRHLTPNQTAAVALQAFPERPLAAHIASIAPQVDPSRGTVRVDLEFDAPAPDWVRPDMTATVEVVLGQTDHALVLAVEWVADRGGARPWVLVAEDGVAVRRDITLGLEGQDVVEVRSGLDPTDIVLAPFGGTQPGDSVRIDLVSGD